VQKLIITQPDDWHVHLRDGIGTSSIVSHTARQFRRAIVMPNLVPPVTTVDQALAYRQRILNLLPDTSTFDPLMTLYLTDNTSAEEIKKAANSPYVHAVKLYPAGATTNSDAGVTDIKNAAAAIAAMEETGFPLLIHGEVTKADVDVFDREAVFIEQILQPLLKDFPKLKVVLEHITTKDGVEFVAAEGDNVAGTLTAHHLLLNRNAIFQGGIQPHHYCLPILKRETHRQALLAAATSGDSSFFLGTDSAPHLISKKETSCGCAGIYTSHAAIEFYAEAFESVNALDKLEAFASFNGPRFYGLPINSSKITLEKSDWSVPAGFSFHDENVVPFMAEKNLTWKLKTDVALAQ